jgi:DNA-binding response OmpR family regulator
VGSAASILATSPSGQHRRPASWNLSEATILLVEDDPAVADVMVDIFAGNGCRVWHAETGADARAMFKHARPDLVILDLTLPDVDGLVLCTSLKSEAGDIPIIICSATGTQRDKLLGFKLGADDFIPKPFDVDELEARAAVALRRRVHNSNAAPAIDPTPQVPGRLRLGELVIDLPQWRVTLGDRRIDLTPTEFQLLAFLANHVGEIVSRDELARSVWGHETMSGSRTIDAYVRRIRAKLTDGGGPTIFSVRGCGYQLGLPLAVEN